MTDDVYRLVGATAHWLLRVPPAFWLTTGLAHVCGSLWANWTIVRRAGYPGCWSLMFYVPCVNVVFMLGFAFGRWPVEGKRPAR